LIEKIVAMQKDLVNILRKCLSAMKLAKENAIISKDILLMEDNSQAYYQRKHQLIMHCELEQEENEKKEKEKKELEEKEQHEKEALEAKEVGAYNDE
jgi:hypothetical protein